MKYFWLYEIVRPRKHSESHTIFPATLFISQTPLLVTGKLMQQPADVADGEKSGSIQVGQNLNQDVWWQPAAQVIKRSQKKEVTAQLPVLRQPYKCVYDRIKRLAVGWCSHFADLACWGGEKPHFHWNQSNFESLCNQIRNLSFSSSSFFFSFLYCTCCNLLQFA